MAGTTFAQERVEKNVSVDCGKGNTFHKVHGFVGCFISHSDDFQGAIDHIIDDVIMTCSSFIYQKLRAK